MSGAHNFPQPPRDPLALVMFAAWVNVPADRIPATMIGFTCSHTRAAWQRVAEAARAHIAGEVSA